MRILTFITLIILASCSLRSSAMTRLEYDDVALGSSASQLICQLGEPYAIHCLRCGGEEYEYIEKFAMNGELVYETHFFLKVVNDQIVSKRMTVENRPAYDLIWQEDPNYPTYP